MTTNVQSVPIDMPQMIPLDVPQNIPVSDPQNDAVASTTRLQAQNLIAINSLGNKAPANTATVHPNNEPEGGVPLQGAPLRSLCSEVSGSMSTVASRIPVELVWKDLNIFTKSKKNYRSILKDVSGVVRPGQFLAIIGASGAGKTTLLNYLSGKMLAHNLVAEGVTTINGKSTKESQNYLEFTAFVQQEDVLMETLTVMELLEYAARFKFSPDPERRKKRVEELLDELELNDIKDVYFGGVNLNTRTLSRGEKKRLSIAVELITNPSLLFLDEPTTSMDTFTAEKIVAIINKLRKKDRTVIATIHQPNTQIYNSFDRLMIMSLGRVIYNVYYFFYIIE